jgi:PTH1 family peptidyl-tRNA hydrolase
MWLVVGLGNPGPKYERTRHNVGFMAVEELARRNNLGSFRAKWGGETASGLLPSMDKVLLLKPMEYMNNSGFAVQRAARFHDVEAEKMIVIHDDIDLDVGRVKLKRGGGHGGHNGLRSIIQQLGERDFLRVRLGVGKPGPNEGGGAAARDRRVAGYVLSEFAGAERDLVEDMIRRGAEAAEAIVADGIVAAMNEFNKRGSADEEAN